MSKNIISTANPGFNDPEMKEYYLKVINTAMYKALKDYKYSKRFLIDSLKNTQDEMGRRICKKELNRISGCFWKPDQLKMRSVKRFRNQFKRFAQKHSKAKDLLKPFKGVKKLKIHWHNF